MIRPVFAGTRSDFIRCAYDEMTRLHTQRRNWNGNYGENNKERENKNGSSIREALNSNRIGHAFVQRYGQTALNTINLYGKIKRDREKNAPHNTQS